MVVIEEDGMPQQQPPKHSSFALCGKQDRVLKVESGEVNITSTIAPSKHIMLTSNCWVQLMSLRHQIDVEAKETNHQMRPVAFCEHIGDDTTCP